MRLSFSALGAKRDRLRHQGKRSFELLDKSEIFLLQLWYRIVQVTCLNWLSNFFLSKSKSRSTLPRLRIKYATTLSVNSGLKRDRQTADVYRL